MSKDRLIDPSDSASERVRRDVDRLLSDLLKTGLAVEPPGHPETLSPVKRKRRPRKAPSTAKADPALSVVDFAVGATRLFGEWRCRALFVFSNDECVRLTERIVDGPSVTDRIIQWSVDARHVGREAIASGIACVRNDFVSCSGISEGIEPGYIFCLGGQDNFIDMLRNEHSVRTKGGLPMISGTAIRSWTRMINGAGLWIHSAGGHTENTERRYVSALESFSANLIGKASEAGIDLHDVDPLSSAIGIPDQFFGNGESLADGPLVGAGITLVANQDNDICVYLHGDGRNPLAIQLAVAAGESPDGAAIATIDKPQTIDPCVSCLDGEDIAEPWFWAPSEDPARKHARAVVESVLTKLLKGGTESLLEPVVRGSGGEIHPEAFDGLDEQSIIGLAVQLREKLALDGLCRIDVDPYSMGQTIARSTRRRYVVGDAEGIESGGFRDGMPVVFADGGEREYRRNERYASVICPADGTVISLDCRRIREVLCEPAP